MLVASAEPDVVLTLLGSLGDLLVFDRVEDGERLRCAFNLGDAPVAFAVGDGVLLAQGYDDGMLAPWGAVIATA